MSLQAMSQRNTFNQHLILVAMLEDIFMSGVIL